MNEKSIQEILPNLMPTEFIDWLDNSIETTAIKLNKIYTILSLIKIFNTKHQIKISEDDFKTYYPYYTLYHPDLQIFKPNFIFLHQENLCVLFQEETNKELKKLAIKLLCSEKERFVFATEFSQTRRNAAKLLDVIEKTFYMKQKKFNLTKHNKKQIEDGSPK